MAARLEVGRVGRAHGLRGEVAIIPVSNRPERFAPGAELFIGDVRHVVAASRAHGDRWLVKFEGVDDRTSAEALRNRVVSGDADVNAPEGELWVHELIGSEVHDTHGTRLGRVVAVEANPAHDLLVLDDDTLIPMVFVVSADVGVIVVDPPEGLLTT